MRKELSHAMLKLHNIGMKSSNMRKKVREPPMWKKNVGTAQNENKTIKCEKKNKRTTKCEKRIVTCDVRTA